MELPQKVERSYDVTNTLRLCILGKVILIEERNGVDWSVVVRVSQPNTLQDAYKILHQYSKENQAKIARAKGTQPLRGLGRTSA